MKSWEPGEVGPVGKPHPSAEAHERELMETQYQDCLAWRVLVFDRGRDKDLLADVVCSSQARVPKYDHHGREKAKGRQVHNLSEADGESVNAKTDTHRYPGVFLPTVADIVRMILYYKQRFPGVPVLIAKRDVEGAYKREPLESKGARFMGTRLGKYTFVATTLTFGWEPSPGIYSVAATAISSYHMAHVPENPRDNGGESLASVTYVDDGILIAVDIGVLPEVCARVYELGMVLTLGRGP